MSLHCLNYISGTLTFIPLGEVRYVGQSVQFTVGVQFQSSLLRRNKILIINQNRKMSSYKLTYFNMRGIAEPVRYLLSYLEKEFDDVRIPIDQWLAVKESMPFGKIPILEIDGKVFHESTAICRYLGNEAGLAGNTSLENLEIDQVVGAVSDLRGEISTVLKSSDPDTKEKNRQNVANEIFPFYYGRFEKRLEKNNGYLANGKLSWADIYLVGLSESVAEVLQVNVTEMYPRFRALQEEVQSLPGVKEWISQRPVSLI